MTNTLDLIKKWKELIDSFSDNNKKESQTVPPDKRETSEGKEESFSLKSSLEKQISSLKTLKEKDSSLFISYIDKLLNLQALETKDTKKLEKLKSEIEAEKLQKSQIEDVVSTVSKLEKKADSLDPDDLKIIKELEKIISETQVSASKLKDEVEDKKLEAKKEMIEKIRKKLDAHRYSSRLSDSVCNYLTDKFINKTEMWFFSKIMWWLWLSVAGIFLWSKLKDLISSINSDSLENITDKIKNWAENIKDNLKNKWQLTAEELKKLEDPAKQQMKTFLEEKLWKKIDQNKFTQVFEKWRKERWPELTKQGKEFWTHIQEWRFNIIDEVWNLLIVPPKAMIDLTVQLTNSWVTSRWDLSLNLAILPSGKAVIEAWLTAVWLFSNWLSTVFWKISLEDYTDYIKSHVSRMNVSSKEAMRWLLYRQWWVFRNLAWHIGTGIWEAMSLIFMEKNAWDIGKLSAYRKGWIMQNFQKELDVFKQLETALTDSWVFAKENFKWWATHLEDLMKTAQKNTQIFDIMHSANTLPEIEKKLTEQWLSDVLEQLKWKQRDAWNLKTVKQKAWNIIESSMNKTIWEASDELGKFRKFFASKVNFPRMKYNRENKLLSDLWAYSKIQWKLLQKTEFLHPLKKVFLAFEKWKTLGNIVDYTDGVKLNLKDVKTAKEFFDNINTIWRSSPEILKTLFKWFPLIMVWKEVLDKLSDPNNNDPTTKIFRDWLMYLTPIIWPFLLIHEWIEYDRENGWFKSLSSVWIWAGIMAIDGFYAYKASQLGWLKGIWKYMLSPLTDARKFAKSVWTWTYTALKMTKDGVNVLKAGEFATFAKTFWKFWLKTSWKLMLLGLAWYWVYQWYEYFMDSAEEQAQFYKFKKMTPAEQQAELEKNRKNQTPEQKEILIKLATATRMWISNLDLIDSKREKNQIYLSFWTLVDKDQLTSTKSDMQLALTTLEWNSDTTLNYVLNWWKLRQELLGRKSDFFDTNWHFDALWMTKYIMTAWYSSSEALQMMKNIVNSDTYTQLETDLKKQSQSQQSSSNTYTSHTTTPKPSPTNKNNNIEKSNNLPANIHTLTSAQKESVISYMQSQIWTPYKRWKTWNGWYDCSGLIYDWLKSCWMIFPRRFNTTSFDKNDLAITTNQVQRWDLIHFPANKRWIKHIEMTLWPVYQKNWKDFVQTIGSASSDGWVQIREREVGWKHFWRIIYTT